jgi:hypothetical protein
MGCDDADPRRWRHRSQEDPLAMITLTVALVIAGFALVIAVVAKLGGGPDDGLVSLFASPTMPPRPRGVQAMDLPRFVFRDC